MQLPVPLSSVWGASPSAKTDAGGRNLRTATSMDLPSVMRNGVVRQEALGVSTTSSTLAGLYRDTELTDRATLTPRASFTIRRLYTLGGARAAVWEPQVGDFLRLRNLPPAISVEIDRIRRFRITRITRDIDAGTITVEPESPLPQVEWLIARAAVGDQSQAWTGKDSNTTKPVKRRLPQT